jgi:hypothetical protein
VKAITLVQPRATLIAIGALFTETRPHGTPHRGQVAIHAAFWIPSFAHRLIESEPVWSILKRAHVDHLALPRGFVVAVADLVECEEIGVGFSPPPNRLEIRVNDFDEFRFIWRFEKVRPLVPPIRANGRPGLWDWPPPSWWQARLQPVREASAL